MAGVTEYSAHHHHNTGHHVSGQVQNLIDFEIFFLPDFEHFYDIMFVQKHGQGNNSWTISVILSILSDIKWRHIAILI